MKDNKTIVKVISFLLILTLILISADHVLKVKYVDGIYSMERFYELEDNSVDVLILGSSHAFETYNTSVLWDNYGIASFVLGGSVQPLWNTYFFMKEALKTQTPDLIVLEAFCVIFSAQDELNDYSRQIKNCYGMKPSLNKLEAMYVSSFYSTAPTSSNLKFFFPISNYSSRYNELTMEDFVNIQQIRKYDNWMGFASNYGSEEKETPCLPSSGAEAPMAEEVEKYYRKILQLADEKQIPILVVVSPYSDISEEEAAIFRYAERITGEYDNASFLNPALDPSSIGLDFSIHAAEGNHLNAAGNKVYTVYFGDYLKSNYSIHDRRGNPDYQDWDDCSAYIKRLDSIRRLKKQYQFESICDQINSERFCAFIVVGKYCKNASEILKPFGTAGCEPFNVYCFNEGKNQAWKLNTDVITYQQIYLLFHDDLVYADRNRFSEEYAADSRSIKVVIYDTITDDVCDVFALDESEPGIVYR